MHQFSDEEVKEHYRSSQHLYALDPYAVRSRVLEYLISLKCERYFEFGANCGYNLNHIKERRNNTHVMGMDISKFACDYGREHFNIPLICSDECGLTSIPPNSYDVVFTSSVLCHIPEVKDTINNLIRIAKKHVVCMESNVTEEPNFWKHDYEQYGFKPEFDVINPRGGKEMLYRCYTIHNVI